MSKFTDRYREVLVDLMSCHDCQYPLEWARPLDLGGCSGSDTSYRLNKLAKVGLVEARQRNAWANSRGSKVYRITDAGRIFLSEQAA